METTAAAAPAWGFFSSFLLLAFRTLVAALLGAAHRLGLFYQLMHKVDTASIRHGGENVAAVLKAHGVRFLFTLVGRHISPLLVACEKPDTLPDNPILGRWRGLCGHSCLPGAAPWALVLA